MVDSQKEFEINLGRAVDTLKSDYPKLLTENPSWNIYHPDLEVIDPTGVSLHGLDNYKMAFGFIHGVVKWFYCEEKSGLTSIRVGYDWARKCIRYVCLWYAVVIAVFLPCSTMNYSLILSMIILIVSFPNNDSVSWNVELIPRMIYGGTRRTLHVDGISEYYLDRESGLITEHKVSHLIINDQAIMPENGIFHALAEMSPADPDGVPVFFRADANNNQALDMTHAKFQTWNPLNKQSSSLFANPNEQAMQFPDNASKINTDNAVPYDRDALQRKNDSRKKFGMPPITPEEFIKIEQEVRSMDAKQKKKATYMAEQLAQQASSMDKQKNKENDGFLSKIFGGVLKNGCESNFDCERPEVCCDVGFKKICCSNGLGIVDGIPVERYERALLRVPMGNDDFDY